MPAEAVVELRPPGGHGLLLDGEGLFASCGVGGEHVFAIVLDLVGRGVGIAVMGQGGGQGRAAVNGVGVGGDAAFAVTAQRGEPGVIDAPERRIVGGLLREDLHAADHAVHAGLVTVMVGERLHVEPGGADHAHVDDRHLPADAAFQENVVIDGPQGDLGRKAGGRGAGTHGPGRSPASANSTGR